MSAAIAVRINIGGEALRRECSKCHQLKHPREFYTHWTRQGPYLLTACKACKIASARRYEKLNPEATAARVAKWQRENTVQMAAHRARWRSENAAAERDSKRKYKKTAKGRAAIRRYREKYRSELLAKSAAYKAAHPARVKAWANARRARLANAVGYCSVEQLQARIDFYGGLCAYCGDQYETVDHVIPISRGGSNWPANLRPSCATCNLSKAAKRLRDWRP